MADFVVTVPLNIWVFRLRMDCYSVICNLEEFGMIIRRIDGFVGLGNLFSREENFSPDEDEERGKDSLDGEEEDRGSVTALDEDTALANDTDSCC